ncbi:helix-turn-helix domain-containing protein, partial [Meiothermus taiwanensis]
MQLTTVGKPLLKAANQASQLEQAGAGDPVVAERLRKLKLVETLRKKKVPWDEVQKLVGISKATYHRWKKRLEEQDLAGLKPKSRKPR